MKFVEKVRHFNIYEASREECSKGVDGMKWDYPCFCVFYDDEENISLKTSLSDFSSLEEAVLWCR